MDCTEDKLPTTACGLYYTEAKRQVGGFARSHSLAWVTLTNFYMVTNQSQPVQSCHGVIHPLSLASNMSHYQLYSKYVASPSNSLVTSLKKNRKMVFGVESLFTWVASLIFSVHSARRKGGYHQSFKCRLSAYLTSSRLLPSLLQLPAASVSSLRPDYVVLLFSIISCSVCILITKTCAIMTRRNYILLRMTLLD